MTETIYKYIKEQRKQNTKKITITQKEISMSSTFKMSTKLILKGISKSEMLVYF